jgi:MFS transporter, DHA2 family, multidrug resistance protein
MMVLVYFGIPWQPLPKPKEGQPKPNWRGFLYASLGVSLLYIALDQGQRLYWLNSGVIVGLIASGAFLIAATVVRHFVTPNPLVNFKFLARRNTILLSFVLFLFRFVLLAIVVAIPSFLASVQGYRPLQTGPVLLWVALPQCLLGLLAIYLLKYIDARLILSVGFGLVAVACFMNAQVSSVWSGSNFRPSQAVISVGLALAFNAMVGSIILEVLNTGALTRPVDVLTFAGFFQTIRLFGGECGSAFIGHFIPTREQFHSNILGLSVGLGRTATDQRLFGLTAGVASQSPGLSTAVGRAGEILSLQVRQQAFTMAIADSFQLIAWAAIGCLIIIACMATVPTQFRQVTRASAGPA